VRKDLLRLETFESVAREALFLHSSVPGEDPRRDSNMEFPQKLRGCASQTSWVCLPYHRFDFIETCCVNIKRVEFGWPRAFLRGTYLMLTAFLAARKTHEIMAMMLLGQVFASLDETDSGLDIDALQFGSAPRNGGGVTRVPLWERSFISRYRHYQRLLDFIIPVTVQMSSRLVAFR